MILVFENDSSVLMCIVKDADNYNKPFQYPSAIENSNIFHVKKLLA